MQALRIAVITICQPRFSGSRNNFEELSNSFVEPSVKSHHIVLGGGVGGGAGIVKANPSYLRTGWSGRKKRGEGGKRGRIFTYVYMRIALRDSGYREEERQVSSGKIKEKKTRFKRSI